MQYPGSSIDVKDTKKYHLYSLCTMSSTLETCYNRSPETCATDNRCTLQYDASDENATCVPNLGDLPSHHISNADLSIINSIVKRLLPSRVQGLDSMLHDRDAFDRELQNLSNELRPKISWRVEYILRDRRNEISSWTDLIQRVAREVIDDIRAYNGDRIECPICGNSVRDNPNDLIVKPCCGAIYHRECSLQWRNGEECPSCRARLSIPSVSLSSARESLLANNFRQFFDDVNNLFQNPPQPHDYEYFLAAITTMISEENLSQLHSNVANTYVQLARTQRIEYLLGSRRSWEDLSGLHAMTDRYMQMQTADRRSETVQSFEDEMEDEIPLLNTVKQCTLTLIITMLLWWGAGYRL